jgi:M6 family metalloprotease-like protein
MHNKLPVPTNDYDLYVPDFTPEHYEKMMFTPGGWTFPQGVPFYAGQRRPSMRDVYTQMSHGRYTVGGNVHGWFRVDKPEVYYGDDNPEGGNDNQLPGTTRDLIADAVAKVNASHSINWAEYDTDGDCVVDHPLFVHAGADQSGGGGAQGDDAIWAHRSTGVNVKVADKAGCGVAASTSITTPSCLRTVGSECLPMSSGTTSACRMNMTRSTAAAANPFNTGV